MRLEGRSRWRIVFLGLVIAAAAGQAAAQSHTVAWPRAANRTGPKEFGTQDETITVVSSSGFSGGFFSGVTYEDYAPLSIPAGAVIDSIGVNNKTDTDGVMGAALWQRDRSGVTTLLYGFSLPAHDWDTDFAGPLGILVPDHLDKELVLNVETVATGQLEQFAWVEVHWHRTVSAPPTTPTFNDVPPGDFGYQYIEALAASGITGGCGGGSYCPDANLTRRQMAIFLAKALGLHWPN